MPGGAEQQTFTLEAVLRQAKVEGNDCEIHLEFIETARKNALRVIVEIPLDSSSILKLEPGLSWLGALPKFQPTCQEFL